MSESIIPKNQKTDNIKGHLRWAALFLGELRDGLTMVRLVTEEKGLACSLSGSSVPFALSRTYIFFFC